MQELKILGPIICTKPRKRADGTKLDQLGTPAKKLLLSNLPFDQRMRMAGMLIVPSAVDGTSFTLPTGASLMNFKSALLTGTWGNKFPKRNPDAVLGVLGKAHLTDPEIVMKCRSIKLLVRMGVNPEHKARIHDVWSKYDGDFSKPLGPIGIAGMHMKSLGLVCEGNLTEVKDVAGKPVKWLNMKNAELNHDLRERTRKWKWARVEKERPSLTGISSGICLERTNELRLSAPAEVAHALRIIIAGGVITRSYLSKWKGCNICQHCTEEKVEDEHHLWWTCKGFNSIREQKQYTAVMKASKTSWPRCLMEHGILPKGKKIDVKLASVQMMMAEIYIRRRQIEIKGK